MLKVALLLGGALLLALSLRNRALLDFAAWLLALVVALIMLLAETYLFLLPFLPKILPSGLLAAILHLVGGGQP